MKISRSVLINSLIVAVSCASVVTVLVTSGSVTTKDSEGREQNLLPVFRAEDVVSLELFANNQHIALKRAETTDGGSAAFELVSPVKELADTATVDKFLGGLAARARAS
jgi:hypothetical protein